MTEADGGENKQGGEGPGGNQGECEIIRVKGGEHE